MLLIMSRGEIIIALAKSFIWVLSFSGLFTKKNEEKKGRYGMD